MLLTVLLITVDIYKLQVNLTSCVLCVWLLL